MKQYDWDKIHSEYNAGKALNAISRQYGCNRATIRNHAKQGDWKRPDPSDTHKEPILSKATHEELLEFNPTYQKCYDDKIKGLNYYHKVKPEIRKLRQQNASLRKKMHQYKRAENTTFLALCLNKIMRSNKLFSSH